MKERKNNVKDWTEEDERKYREMFARRKNYENFDLNKLAEAQKGICESVVGNLNNPNIPKTQEDMARCFQQETPMFSQSSEDIAKTLSDAGIKAAKATHEFNMMEIKTKLIADLTIELARRTSNGRLDGNFIGNKVNEIVNAVFKDE